MVAALTELEAVNICLALNGDEEVTEATEDSPASVAKALRLVRHAARAVQTVGWYFNRECRTVQRNVDGEVVVGQEVFRVDASSWQDKIQPILRGNRVYDLANNTYVFDKDPELEIHFFLDFSDLPAEAREYITIKAARAYVLSEGGDRELSLSREDEIRAEHNLIATDAAQEDLTTRDSVYMRSVFSERGIWSQ